MLAFILLVVLGGGVGLLAVSLAESNKPATNAGSQRRDPSPAGREPDPPSGPPDEHHLGPDRHEDEPAGRDPVAPNRDHDEAETAGLVVHTRAPEPRDPDPELRPPAPTRPARRPIDPRHVPKAFTAIEGTYADVARPPLWRRLLSLVGIILIAVAIGVGLAAFLGAVIGASAEILGNTIE